MISSRTVSAASILLISATSARAGVNIVPQYEGTWTDPQKAIVNAAIAYWTAKLVPYKHQDITITLVYEPLDLSTCTGNVECLLTQTGNVADSPQTLGSTFPFVEKPVPPGLPKPRSARIAINNALKGPPPDRPDLGPKMWWEGGPNDPPPAGSRTYDLYSVLIHEIGHAIGFTVNYTKFRNNRRAPTQAEIDANQNLAGKFVYDDGRNPVTALSHAGGTHTDERDGLDVMNPRLAQGTRVLVNPRSGPVLQWFWNPANPKKQSVPTVSEWGLVVLTLIGLAAGTILLRREAGKRRVEGA